MQLTIEVNKLTLIVRLHDRRSLQLFPKMYYYASTNLRSETTLQLKNHSTYVKNNHTRMDETCFIGHVPSCHYVCLVWQHHDVLQTSAIALKRLRIGPKGAHFWNFWNHLCQKRAYCEISRATKKIRLVPTWKKTDCSICPVYFQNNVAFTLTTRNRVANVCDRYPKSKMC